jgi:tetratricopeptide (TPR) repeat protein
MCLIVPVYAEKTIEETVDELIAAGQSNEAKNTLRDWLLQNPSHESFPSAFFLYFELETDISRIDGFLSRFLSTITKAPYVYLVWERKAVLEELTGRIEEAQRAYHRAAGYVKGQRRAAYLIESARLLFEQGLVEEARGELAAVYLTTKKMEVLALAKVLEAYIAASEGQVAEAEGILKTLLEIEEVSDIKPQVLLALIALNRDDETSRAPYLKILEEDYPKSPEYALALKVLDQQETDFVFFLFTPRIYLDFYLEEDYERSTVLAEEETSSEVEESQVTPQSDRGVEDENLAGETGERETTEKDSEKRHTETGDRGYREVILVQTGSFIDPENAEYMKRDLERLGFEVDILIFESGNKTYHRVVIIGIDSYEEAQTVLIKLKERGFEGMIITR